MMKKRCFFGIVAQYYAQFYVLTAQQTQACKVHTSEKTKKQKNKKAKM